MNITDNGTFLLNTRQTPYQSKTSIFPTGVFGGAVLTLSIHGNPVTDGVMTDGTALILTHGAYVEVSVVVTGATGTTDIELNTHAVA